MPDSSGPSWKHTGGQANRPTASRKTWQPGKAPAARGPADPRRKYRRRLALAGFSGAMLVGLVVAVILMISPPKKPTLIVVAPDVPGSTVSADNAAGSLAAKGLADFAQNARHGPKQSNVFTDPATAGKWYDAIDNSTGPLLLHFACPGFGDKTGAYLWLIPADAAVAEPAHRVPIAEVLNRLRAFPDRPKLLILDVATEPVSWARGQLHNDFARRLKLLDADIKSILNLVVICSANDDERSWVAEEWRQTAFNHFLIEGLKGAAADASSPLTALKLFQYLQTNVAKWAQANRDADQKPFLLPLDGGDARADQMVVATLGPDSYTAATPGEAPGRAFTVPDSLSKAWEQAERLATASPPPEIKAPHVWRQYLDLLLRAERIIRVTGEMPGEVALRLAQLERDLGAAPWKAEPACLPFSLPAGRALGYPRKAVSADDFRAVWREEDAKRNESWTTQAERLDRDRLRAGVRLAGAEALLALLNSEQMPDKAAMDRAEALLKHVDVGQPRPVETHVLLTLQRHLTTVRDASLIRQALAVAVQAEQTAWFAGTDEHYPYAEQVGRWFGKRLEAIDKQRRDATDLVFAGDEKSGPLARQGLEAASKQYAELGKDAATLGAGYRLRDRVHSRLPYYARWAAGRRELATETTATLDLVEQTAVKAHELSEVLENPDPAQIARVKQIVRDLDAATQPPGLFRTLEMDFLRFLGTLRSEAVPANWHAHDNALAVPFIPAKSRVELLDRLRSISRRLNEGADPSGAKPEAAKPREMAQRQGRMALAILGNGRVTELQAGSPLGWRELRQRVDSPDLGAWWESISDAGERIGATFVALTREANKSADKGARGDSAVAQAELTRAARLARLIDGATVLTGPNPAALERRFWTHILLIGMGERAAAEGWAALDAVAPQPYCLLAANRFLESASGILLDGDTAADPAEKERRLKTVKSAQERLKAPSFDLTVRDRITLTDQAAETLPYQVGPLAGATGNPVVRISGLTPPLESREVPPNEYRPVPGFVDPKTTATAGTFNLSVTKVESGSKGQVVLDLLYRGEKKTKIVQAAYEGTPTYRWIYNPPTGLKGTFAIKGDEALRNGAVAFLVDVSASMRDATGPGKTRYLDALDGLKTVMSNLPEGTLVSVSVFAGKTITGVDPLLAPTRWQQPAVQAEAVYKLLNARMPDGPLTPIADSIKEALERTDLFPGKEFNGFRNLVVVTDGCDTIVDELNTPPTARPGHRVVDAVKATPQDVGLHLVLFGLDEREYRSARTQFDVIEESRHYETSGRTQAQIWPKKLEGKESRLKESIQLAEVLKEAMLPRATIRRKETTIGQLPVSIAADRFWRWFPLQDEGLYHLWALGSRQTVQLDPGDRLLLEAKRGAGGIELTLPSYADARTDPPVRARATSADRTVHLTVPRNLLTPRAGGYDLDLTATLEKPILAREQIHRDLPLFAWFEVTPQSADKMPIALRVENLLRRPAPAWRLTSAPWVPEAGQAEVKIAPALPRVDAYWLEREPPAKATMEFSSLNVANRELKDKDRKFTVDGGEVEVEGDLDVRDGFLTLRLNHSEKKPVVVRIALQGVSQRWTLGEDHKFFGIANRYTATFGPIRAEDLERRLTLEFYSIASIKSLAKKATVDVRTPPDVNATDLLPEEKLGKD